MAYTPATVEQVREILPADTTLTDAQIQAAIDAAKCIVDRIAAGCGSDLSEECLTQIHIYLSAHVAAVTENTLSLSSEKDPTCGGSATYGFQFGEGVKGTPFGQMANTLSGGCLAEEDKQPVNLFSIGSH
jgi:hypothetical protein